MILDVSGRAYEVVPFIPWSIQIGRFAYSPGMSGPVVVMDGSYIKEMWVPVRFGIFFRSNSSHSLERSSLEDVAREIREDKEERGLDALIALRKALDMKEIPVLPITDLDMKELDDMTETIIENRLSQAQIDEIMEDHRIEDEFLK